LQQCKFAKEELPRLFAFDEILQDTKQSGALKEREPQADSKSTFETCFKEVSTDRMCYRNYLTELGEELLEGKASSIQTKSHLQSNGKISFVQGQSQSSATRASMQSDLLGILYCFNLVSSSLV